MSDFVDTPRRLPRSRIGRLPRALRRLDWKRVEARYDRPSETPGAARLRKGLALLFFAFAAAMTYASATHGDLNAGPFVILLGAAALFAGRGGRFVYYFVPVFLGLLGYSLAGGFAQDLKLGVHYLPQLRAEEWLTPGPIPTVWLQEHLYHGSTGPLEVFAVAMYVSHFWVPLAFGFGLAMANKSQAFRSLMFGLLAVAVLGEITFVLAPTAPPWLAAQNGLLPDVHHVLKQSLYDLHLGKLAELVGDPSKYDVTAAVPSLHVAFPVICVLTALRYRLPTWVTLLLVLNTIGVAFAIVYTGEHYLFDALVGVAYALVAWWIVHLLLGRDARPAETPAPAPAPIR